MGSEMCVGDGVGVAGVVGGVGDGGGVGVVIGSCGWRAGCLVGWVGGVVGGVGCEGVGIRGRVEGDWIFFFFQAKSGILFFIRSRGLGGLV